MFRTIHASFCENEPDLGPEKEMLKDNPYKFIKELVQKEIMDKMLYQLLDGEAEPAEPAPAPEEGPTVGEEIPGASPEEA